MRIDIHVFTSKKESVDIFEDDPSYIYLEFPNWESKEDK